MPEVKLIKNNIQDDLDFFEYGDPEAQDLNIPKMAAQQFNFQTDQGISPRTRRADLEMNLDKFRSQDNRT